MTACDWTTDGAPPAPGLAETLRLIPGYDPIATRGTALYHAPLGDRAIAFIEECCRHVKGELAGQPIRLERWQRAIVLNLFGWVRPDGTRRYREGLLYISRKQGKSFLCACIGLYLFFCDGEAGAEIYCAAAEKEQASLVWKMACQMIQYEPELAKRCKIYTALKSIENQKDGSYFKPLSREALTKHGFNAHAVLFDELHTQPNGDMMDVLETSMGARTQPLMLYLTTADYERENSPCNAKHDYACKVRDGVIDDPTFLPIIYEVTDKEDWTSPEVWKKANPNLGVSVSLDYLERKCAKAKELPSYQNTFKRLHLNIRTRSDVKWLPMDHWEACCDTGLDVESLAGLDCYGGLDLASTADLCAFTLFFPSHDAVLCWFWLPEETVHKRTDRGRAPYRQWVTEGHITQTPGNVADYDLIRRDINAAFAKYRIRQVAVDRWNSTHLQTQLTGDGFEVVPFGQGFGSMNAPSKELERRVLRHELNHLGNPVLTWCASNVQLERDGAGNIKPSKKRSAEKIDGIVSLVMSLGIAGLDGAFARSVYESRGLDLFGDEGEGEGEGEGADED